MNLLKFVRLPFSGGVSVSGDVVTGGKALCQRLTLSNVDELCLKSTKQSDSVAAPCDAYDKLRACGVPELRREEVQNVQHDEEEVTSKIHICLYEVCNNKSLICWVWNLHWECVGNHCMFI